MRRSCVTLTRTRATVLRAIAQRIEPPIPGHAARKARRELEELGLVSLPPGFLGSSSWADWGLTTDGKILIAQLETP
jgi:hypothetical protein